jgi:hypothetical protein
MKEIKMIFKPGGKCVIDAHGLKGEGTAKFTEELAKELGEIKERHICHTHNHSHDHNHQHTEN